MRQSVADGDDLLERSKTGVEEDTTVAQTKITRELSEGFKQNADEEMGGAKRKAVRSERQIHAEHASTVLRRMHKSYHADLAAALGVAWRKYNREWSVDDITNGGKVVVSSEGLMRAFTRMDDLKREAPQRPLGEVSEQVIQEMEIQ